MNQNPTWHQTTLDEERETRNVAAMFATDIWKTHSEIIEILKRESKGSGYVSNSSIEKYTHAFNDILDAFPQCVLEGDAMPVNVSALLRCRESFLLRSNDHKTVYHKLAECARPR